METISLVHSFFKTSNYFPLENNYRSRKKCRCDWWTCNNILKAMGHSALCRIHPTHQVHCISWKNRENCNEHGQNDRILHCECTHKTGCVLECTTNEKKFLGISVMTGGCIHWGTEMCHDKEVKSPKLQPSYIMRKLNTLMQGRSSLTDLDRTS